MTWSLLVLLVACPPEGEVLPTVAIDAPADGVTVTGPDVTVELSVEDFDWVPPESARLALHEAGESPEGYAEVRLDDDEPVISTEDTVTLTGLAAGEHDLEVELFWPDGDPFYPTVTDEVTFTVQ